MSQIENIYQYQPGELGEQGKQDDLSARPSSRAVEGFNFSAVDLAQPLFKGAESLSVPNSHPMPAIGEASKASEVGEQQPQSRKSNKRRVNRSALRALQLQLAERDQAILQGLEQLHFMLASQVQALHFGQGLHATPLAAARASRRALRKLQGFDLVDHLQRRIGGVRAGSAGFVWYLTSLGYRLLNEGATGHGIASAPAPRKRSYEPSLFHLEHVLAGAQLVADLAEHIDRLNLPKGVGISGRDETPAELLEVSGEPDCWQAYTAAYGSLATLKPDLFLSVQRGANQLLWFVEIDMGTEHRPILSKKIRTYLEAWRSGQIAERLGVFPRVLWVVPNPERAEQLVSLLQAEAGVPEGMCLVVRVGEAAGVVCRVGR